MIFSQTPSVSFPINFGGSLETNDKVYYTLNEIIKDYVYLSNPNQFNDLFDTVAFYDIDKRIDNVYLSAEWKNILLDENNKNGWFSQDELFYILNSENVLSKMYKILEEIYPQNFIEFRDTMKKTFFYEKEMLAAYAGKIAQESVGVCCFSNSHQTGKPTNMPMWYHYTNNYQGICIEYNMDNFQKDELQRVRMFPVKYISTLFDCTSILSEPDITKKMGFDAKIAMHKNIDWSYENEWRYIIGNGIHDKSKPCYPFPVISGIYIGYYTSEANIKLICDIALKKNIPVYKMKLKNSGVDFELYS